MPSASDGTLSKAAAVLRRLEVPAAVAIILGVALFFTRPLLDLDPELVPQGAEFEPNAGLISNAYNAIRHHGTFPLWNPYVHTGVPYLGDPASYFLNPVGSVPGLVLGPINGPKVALFLSVALAGLSGYYFASVLGLSWPARLWAGALLAANGHMAARVFGGQFQLVIAFPVLVFAIAFYIESLRKEGRQYPMLAGASVALLLFSGLLYYFLFVIPGLVLAFLFFAVASQLGGQDREALMKIARRSAAGLAWALGFSAAVLIPFYETSDFVIKNSDPFLRNSQTIPNSFLNFFVSDPEYYATARRGMPDGFMHEYYSYVGFVPALAAPFALLALRRPDRRLLVLLIASLFVMYLAWSSGGHPPVKYVYERYEFLYNFRWTSRALGAATPFLILLGAIGIDELLRLAMHRRLTTPAWRWSGRVEVPALRAGALLAVVLLGLLAYDARSVLLANRTLFVMTERRPDHKEIAAWMEENVEEPAFLRLAYGGTPGVSTRLTEHEIQQFAPVYWDPRLDYGEGIDPLDPEAVIQPRWHYAAVAPDFVPPQEDARLVAPLESRPIYRFDASPPIGTLVSSRDPPVGTAVPWGERAQAAEVRIVNSNVIEVEATLEDGRYDRVLLLQSYFPGWRVEIDGEDAGGAENMIGYLSVEAEQGTHVYRFIFDPRSHRIGLAVTVGTVLGAALYFAAPAVVRRATPRG